MSAPAGNAADCTLWCVAANVVASRPYGPGGQESRTGTKHFKPGVKDYIIDWYPGMCENIIVVGHHRKSHRLMKAAIRAAWVERLRLELVYSPSIIALARDHAGGGEKVLTKDRAEAMLRDIPAWQAEA